jgi:hypothetical protein
VLVALLDVLRSHELWVVVTRRLYSRPLVLLDLLLLLEVLILDLILVLVFLVVHDLNFIALAAEDMAPLLLGLHLSQLSFHFQLGESLLLDTVDVVVQVLGYDDVAQVGNQIRVDSDHLDEVGVASAEHVDDLDAEGLHVKGTADRADVQEHLQAVLLDKLLRKQRRNLLLLRVDKDQS